LTAFKFGDGFAMSEYREERVVSETSDPVVAGGPPRRGNPTPIIVGILIALLLVFLIATTAYG
jgi:hypothetical protein